MALRACGGIVGVDRLKRTNLGLKLRDVKVKRLIAGV